MDSSWNSVARTDFKPYPRQLMYLSPPGYASWKEHLKWCERAAICADASAVSLLPNTAEVKLAIIAGGQTYQILHERAPALYLSRELVEMSLGMASVPLMEDVPLAYTGVHLMLPAGAFPTEVPGQYITSICVRATPTATVSNANPDAGKTTFRVVARSSESIGGEHYVYLADLASRKASAGVGYELQGQDFTASEQVMDVSASLGRLAANVILTLAYAPELQQTDKAVENYRKGFGCSTAASNRNILPITWLGHEVGRETTAATLIAVQEAGGAPRRSPQMHWRRGHYHRVRHGQGRHLVRTDFFPPVLVNADIAEE